MKGSDRERDQEGCSEEGKVELRANDKQPKEKGNDMNHKHSYTWHAE